MLHVGHLEPFVVALQHLHLLVVEPVLESLTVECVGLGEDGIVVDGVLTRVLDALHLEG